ncbi:10919_t:CDS:2, partial [Dentiscutata heterogama]
MLLSPELLPSIPSNINKIKTTTTNSHSSTMTPLRITNRRISSIDSQHVTKDLCKVENKCNDDKTMVDYCSICTEHISVYAVSQCNHRICYLCALRSRVLFETNTCPYCRAQQTKIIFTHDSDTSFSTLLSSKAWYIISDFQILCEDESIYRMVTNTIRLRCPLKSCQVACDDGWPELYQHVQNEKDVPFIFICALSLILSLLKMFTLPSSSNKYFASTLQILDTYVSPIFTSIFQLDLDENSQLESSLHSIYSIGIRVAFVIAYLTM